MLERCSSMEIIQLRFISSQTQSLSSLISEFPTKELIPSYFLLDDHVSNLVLKKEGDKLLPYCDIKYLLISQNNQLGIDYRIIEYYINHRSKGNFKISNRNHKNRYDLMMSFFNWFHKFHIHVGAKSLP